jgi:hypothetical protein
MSMAEVGEQTFLNSPQIANPKILVLNQLSQIRKFLRSAKNRKFSWLMQIPNPQIFTKYGNSPKSRQFMTIFYFVRIEFETLYSIFVRKNNMFLLTCGKMKKSSFHLC